MALSEGEFGRRVRDVFAGPEYEAGGDRWLRLERQRRLAVLWPELHALLKSTVGHDTDAERQDTR
jgi:hypothetical protein